MNTLAQKNILLGVTGGIAAYKSPDLVRRLREHGAAVRVVMTASAQAFITPLTLQAVSGNPVRTELFDPGAEAAMGHIELARWADAVVVAPASADFLARLANGHANDLLTTVCLATSAPIVVAPAMNQQMWHAAATQANVATLRNRNVPIIGPGEGSQACGDVGFGRMLEPQEMVQAVAALFHTGQLAGRKVVVTAGPTREPIDPVRYITNRSSGKMGYAVAQAFVESGAAVTLVSGPVALSAPERANVLHVDTAVEMEQTVMQVIDGADIFVGAAAVADYRCRDVASNKIKKSDADLRLDLTRNPDIIEAVAKHARRPFIVGFAAETEAVAANARAKLLHKQIDIIAANDVSVAGIGFDSDENELQVLWRDGGVTLSRARKQKLARDLVAVIAERFLENR